CQKPYYGPTCQDICYLSCLDQVCTYEGECFSCVPGHSGIYCQDRNDSDYVTLAARATAEADDSSHTEDYSLKNIYIAMLIQMVLL
ncbi:laminin subunit alpha isoform X3, partial [Biomphalaria glabrata]